MVEHFPLVPIIMTPLSLEKMEAKVKIDFINQLKL